MLQGIQTPTVPATVDELVRLLSAGPSIALERFFNHLPQLDRIEEEQKQAFMSQMVILKLIDGLRIYPPYWRFLERTAVAYPGAFSKFDVHRLLLTPLSNDARFTPILNSLFKHQNPGALSNIRLLLTSARHELYCLSHIPREMLIQKNRLGDTPALSLAKAAIAAKIALHHLHAPTIGAGGILQEGEARSNCLAFLMQAFLAATRSGSPDIVSQLNVAGLYDSQRLRRATTPQCCWPFGVSLEDTTAALAELRDNVQFWADKLDIHLATCFATLYAVGAVRFEDTDGFGTMLGKKLEDYGFHKTITVLKPSQRCQVSYYDSTRKRGPSSGDDPQHCSAQVAKYAKQASFPPVVKPL